MIDAPFAFAFAAGIVAAFNPCGFAMLPAYLSTFLSSEHDEGASTPRALLDAARVALIVSIAFALVFGLSGLLIIQLSLGVQRVAPWFTLAIGVVLAGGGIAMLAGWRPTFRIPLPRRHRGGNDSAGVFAFGVSYALASLSCTLPVFLAASAGALARGDVHSGLAVFATYAAGMALVLGALTISVALARRSLITRVRRAVPYISRVSGGLLVAAGIYLVWFGYLELRLGAGSPASSRAVRWVTNASGTVMRWIDTIGITRVAFVLVVALAALAAGALTRRLSRA